MAVVVKLRGDLVTIARKYVRECIERESPPRVSELAAVVKVSRDQLNRLFVERHGVTVTAFLKEEQIEAAKRFLRETDLSITEVAYRAAFGTRRTFHRAFVRSTGMTPAAYRKSAKTDTSTPFPPR